MPRVLILLLILTAPSAFGQHRTPSHIGNWLDIPQVDIPQLDRRIKVTVQLPPNYDTREDLSFPVWYLFDGQNVFDNATAFKVEWKVDEALQAAYEAGHPQVPIVVAINNSAYRENEYIPVDYYRHGSTTVVHGEGQEYAAFVVETLKPFIDETFRTRPDAEHTGVGGSSYGAVLSLWIGTRYPETFGRIAQFSPVGVNEVDPRAVRELISTTMAEHPHRAGQKWFIQLGGKELSFTGQPPATLIQRAEALVPPTTPDRIHVVFDPEGEHDEFTWARNFPKALVWLFF